MPGQILQRIPLAAAAQQRLKALRLLFFQRRGGLLLQVAPAGDEPQQFVRLKGGVLDARLPQRIAGGPVSLRRYQRSSSPSLGSTACTEAMATSIIESSGSAVVSRCSQRPGAEMTRVTGLSWRPANLISS